MSVPFCKDCRFSGRGMCARPNGSSFSLVTGKIEIFTIWEEAAHEREDNTITWFEKLLGRKAADRCGPEGRYFEARKELKPPLPSDD